MEMKDELLSRPLASLTLKEFLEVMNGPIEEQNREIKKEGLTKAKQMVIRKYVYGVDGIAKLFKCSIETAWKIVNSGEIDSAINDEGLFVVADAMLALTLVRENNILQKYSAIE
jgi:hypothetical protein